MCFTDIRPSVIGNGVALNIPVFFKEYNEVVGRGVPAPKILISNRAQMATSYHILFDQYEEATVLEARLSVPQNPELLRSI